VKWTPWSDPRGDAPLNLAERMAEFCSRLVARAPSNRQSSVALISVRLAQP
jgi:hypothetical protein